MRLPTESTRSRRAIAGDGIALAPIALLALALVALAVTGSMSRPVGKPTKAGDAIEARASGESAGSEFAELMDVVGDGRLSGIVEVTEALGDVPDVAREVLIDYRGQGLLLVESGYLDLRGEVWACVVWSGSWSEVCVVRGARDGSSCEVRTMRIEGSGWEESDV